MKRFTGKMISIVLAGSLAAGMLTGCGTQKFDGTKTVATVDGAEIPMGVLSLTARMTQSYYTYLYSMFGSSISWSSIEEGSSQTTGESLRDSILESVERQYILKAKAADYGVELSDEDMERIQAAAAKFMTDNTEETIEALGVNEEMVAQYLELQTYQTRMNDPIREEAEVSVDAGEAQQGSFTYVAIEMDEEETEGAAEEATEAAAEGATEAAVEGATEAAAEGATEAAAEVATEVAAEGATEAAAEEATEAAVEGATEAAVEGATEAAAEVATEAAAEEATEAAAEVATEAAAEEATEAAAEGATEAAAEEATEAAAEKATEAVAEGATEAAVEGATEAAVEEATEAAIAEVTEAAAEGTTEAAAEGTTEAAEEEGPSYTDDEKAQMVLDIMKADPAGDWTDAVAAIDENLSVQNGSFTYNETEDEHLANSFADEVIEILRTLADGEVYDGVIEAEGTYYLVRMDKANDEEATAAKIEDVENELRDEYYTETTDAWLEAADIKVNDKVLKTLEISDYHTFSTFNGDQEAEAAEEADQEAETADAEAVTEEASEASTDVTEAETSAEAVEAATEAVEVTTEAVEAATSAE